MTTPSTDTLGDVLTRLYAKILSRKNAAPNESYTASLLAAGSGRCGKKLGEEAVEAAIAGAVGDKAALTEESADVVYHLLVLMASEGVELDDVAAALAKREGVSGLEEKASRG